MHFLKVNLPKFAIALVTALTLVIILVPIIQTSINLFGPYLGKNSTVLNYFITITAALVAALLLAVTAGWWLKDRLATYIPIIIGLYFLAESLLRAIRLKNFPTFIIAFFKLWLVPDLGVMLLGASIGLASGLLIGAKARREEHYVRLYTFGAALVIIVLASLVVSGVGMFNPLSATTRGVM